MKLLLVFVEYSESNAPLLIDAIESVDSKRGAIDRRGCVSLFNWQVLTDECFCRLQVVVQRDGNPAGEGRSGHRAAGLRHDPDQQGRWAALSAAFSLFPAFFLNLNGGHFSQCEVYLHPFFSFFRRHLQHCQIRILSMTWWMVWKNRAWKQCPKGIWVGKAPIWTWSSSSTSMRYPPVFS